MIYQQRTQHEDDGISGFFSSSIAYHSASAFINPCLGFRVINPCVCVCVKQSARNRERTRARARTSERVRQGGREGGREREREREHIFLKKNMNLNKALKICIFDFFLKFCVNLKINSKKENYTEFVTKKF